MLKIKEICQKLGIRPSRRRGQNFLVNKRVLERIPEIAEFKKDDIILEIGAGLGTLTQELAKRVKKVIAVEIDKRLVEILKEKFSASGGKNYKNIEIIQGNALEEIKNQISKIKNTNQKSKIIKNLKIVGNIPYYITGRLLRIIFELENKPSIIVLMLQKEVAERICAKPEKMSRLSVMVQFYGQPKIRQIVSRNNFWPVPKVDSAILKISQIKTELPRINTNNFFKIVKAGFASPRKYLINNLIKSGIIKKEELIKVFQKIGLNGKIRAQELSVENWLKLYSLLRSYEKFTKVRKLKIRTIS